MKAILTTAIIALLAVSCENRENPDERLKTGADKVAEGMREIGEATADATKEAAGRAGEEFKEVTDKAADAIDDARDKPRREDRE